MKNFAKVRTKYASNIVGLEKGITSLTAMDGGVTPDQVSEVIRKEILPAVEGIKNVIVQIDEALPTTEDEGLGNEGMLGNEGNGEGEGAGMNVESEEDEHGILSANTDGLDEGTNEDDLHTAGSNENPKNTDAADAALQKRLQHVEAKLASVIGENTQMKKAKLAKLYASHFPSHMRTAMEDEFIKENENEEVDAMEAKIESVSKVMQSYKTAGLIKKSNIPVGSGLIQTAKNDKTKGGTKVEIPWNMR